MKLAWFQFYPSDWAKDADLRRCSKAAKGVWIDMMCLMFECEVRGELSTGGQPWSDDEVAAAVGGDSAANLACIRELVSKGVASRNSAGAIFSRRMVRDEQIRHERSKAGKLGVEAKRSKASKTVSKGEARGEESVKQSSDSLSDSNSSSGLGLGGSKGGSVRFVPPGLAEVKLLAAKAGLPEPEAEKFFNFYSANGWKVGRNPMRSLPHAVGNWKLRWQEGGYHGNTEHGKDTRDHSQGW